MFREFGQIWTVLFVLFLGPQKNLRNLQKKSYLDIVRKNALSHKEKATMNSGVRRTWYLYFLEKRCVQQRHLFRYQPRFEVSQAVLSVKRKTKLPVKRKAFFNTQINVRDWKKKCIDCKQP